MNKQKHHPAIFTVEWELQISESRTLCSCSHEPPNPAAFRRWSFLAFLPCWSLVLEMLPPWFPSTGSILLDLLTVPHFSGFHCTEGLCSPDSTHSSFLLPRLSSSSTTATSGTSYTQRFETKHCITRARHVNGSSLLIFLLFQQSILRFRRISVPSYSVPPLQCLIIPLNSTCSNHYVFLVSNLSFYVLYFSSWPLHPPTFPRWKSWGHHWYEALLANM